MGMLLILLAVAVLPFTALAFVWVYVRHRRGAGGRRRSLLAYLAGGALSYVLVSLSIWVGGEILCAGDTSSPCDLHAMVIVLPFAALLFFGGYLKLWIRAGKKLLNNPGPAPTQAPD